MAIKKGIVGRDGVAVSYHRIVSINTVVHSLTSIELASYINQSYRENQIIFDEEQAQIKEQTVNAPYVLTSFYVLPADNDMTISKAYEYIKSLPQFEGAEDVLDDENLESEGSTA